MRAILIRFAIPTLLAVSILAYFGVPFESTGYWRAGFGRTSTCARNSSPTR